MPTDLEFTTGEEVALTPELLELVSLLKRVTKGLRLIKKYNK